jgi:hypothetical protein
MARTKQTEVEKVKAKLAEAKAKRKEAQLKAGVKKIKALKGTKAASKPAQKTTVVTASTPKKTSVKGVSSAATLPVKGSSQKKQTKERPTGPKRHQHMLKQKTGEQMISRGQIRKISKIGGVKRLYKFPGVQEAALNFLRDLMGPTFYLAAHNYEKTLTPAQISHILNGRGENVYYHY